MGDKQNVKTWVGTTAVRVSITSCSQSEAGAERRFSFSDNQEGDTLAYQHSWQSRVGVGWGETKDKETGQSSE